MCQSGNWTSAVDGNAQRTYIRFMRDEIAARHSSLIDQAQSAPGQFLIVESENLVNAQFLIPNYVLLYWIRYFYHSDLVVP